MIYKRDQKRGLRRAFRIPLIRQQHRKKTVVQRGPVEAVRSILDHVTLPAAAVMISFSNILFGLFIYLREDVRERDHVRACMSRGG